MDGLREWPFNLKRGGLCFFSKRNILIPNVAEKIFWFCWRKKKSDSEFLSYNGYLMLKLGEKNCALHYKKNRYSNSRVARNCFFGTIKKTIANPPPCKLEGRSLRETVKIFIFGSYIYPWNDIVWLIEYSKIFLLLSKQWNYFVYSSTILISRTAWWSLTDKTEIMFTAFYTTKYSFFSFFSHHALDIVYKLLASYIA